MWFVPIFAVMTSYQFMIVCSLWCYASATEEFCFDQSYHMSVRKCDIGCVMEFDFDKGGILFIDVTLSFCFCRSLWYFEGI